jgi:hypothetical protein
MLLKPSSNVLDKKENNVEESTAVEGSRFILLYLLLP